jgi:hypothetical protein
MQATLLPVAALAVLAVSVGGCELGRGAGYVEIRTVPTTLGPPVAFYLDAVKLDPLRKGSAVLRQNIGTHKLAIATPSGAAMPLCDVVVKKNRITTVTVSLLDRPPRCQCRSVAAPDAANAGKVCAG